MFQQRKIPAMRPKLIKWFALLILLSVAVWVVGLMTGMECFAELASHRKSEPSKGFPGPKKYGNKKHVA